MPKCYDCKEETPLFSIPEKGLKLSVAVCAGCLKVRQEASKK